jgi:hypothetical protein
MRYNVCCCISTIALCAFPGGTASHQDLHTAVRHAQSPISMQIGRTQLSRVLECARSALYWPAVTQRSPRPHNVPPVVPAAAPSQTQIKHPDTFYRLIIAAVLHNRSHGLPSVHRT